MAERRMFAKTIIDSDAFIDMPVTARLLYYDLAMRADDDGFVNSPKKIMRMIGASQDDLSILILRKFIIPFDNGIVVIKHWRIHNYIRKDMYHETKYKEEKALLETDENNAYTLSVTNPLQVCDETVTNPSTQVRLGKDSIDIDAAKPQKHKHGEFKHVLLTDSDYQKLIKDFGETVTATYIRKVDEYCEQSGKRYKNYYLAIRNTFMARDGVKPQGEQSLENGRYMKDGVLYDRFGDEII